MATDSSTAAPKVMLFRRLPIAHHCQRRSPCTESASEERALSWRSIDFPKVGDPNHDPGMIRMPMTRHHDPSAGTDHAVRRQRSVVDHDRRSSPPTAVHSGREQKASLLAEAHLHGLHGAFPGLAADQPARNSMTHPMIWPRTIAASPLLIPSGAR